MTVLHWPPPPPIVYDGVPDGDLWGIAVRTRIRLQEEAIIIRHAGTRENPKPEPDMDKIDEDMAALWAEVRER